MIVILILLSGAVSCFVPAGEILLQQSLSYEEFDSRAAPFGWRYLNNTRCADSAVALLESYLDANQLVLTSAQRLEIAFHKGQVLAFAGRDKESIPHFQEAVSREAPAEWQSYVEATLAFLKRDADALVSARASYAEIAPNSMRLSVIDGLIACPDKPYAEAVHCR